MRASTIRISLSSTSTKSTSATKRRSRRSPFSNRRLLLLLLKNDLDSLRLLSLTFELLKKCGDFVTMAFSKGKKRFEDWSSELFEFGAFEFSKEAVEFLVEEDFFFEIFVGFISVDMNDFSTIVEESNALVVLVVIVAITITPPSSS